MYIVRKGRNRNSMNNHRQFTFKTFGYFDFVCNIGELLSKYDLADFIKIVFVKAGGKVTIDFGRYELEKDAFLFINKGQFFALEENCCGTLIYYNRDFYCVEIHDSEVGCDGILFNNVYELPVVLLEDEASAQLQTVLGQIRSEVEEGDSTAEEMLRILLKQIIIKCTRLWKQQRNLATDAAKPEVEFSRRFSQMVEGNYTKFHGVADYANLLNISAKALNKRITRYSNTPPNDIIKNRIILESKRLLVHTDLSIKEIAYKLGYEDPSYFIRFFTKQATVPPLAFRKLYLEGELL